MDGVDRKRAVLAAGVLLLAAGCGGDAFESAAPDAATAVDPGGDGAGPAPGPATPDAASVSDASAEPDDGPGAMEEGGGFTVPDGGLPDGTLPDGTLAEDGCALRRWFPDDDQDGYGRSSGAVVACFEPNGKWSTVGGDCNDDNRDVHPGQEEYFEEPYVAVGGEHSFDYDCDGVEEGDPDQPGEAANCGLLGLPCSHVGYVSTGRSGPGLNGLCGSTTLRRCSGSLGALACTASLEEDADPKRCR